MSLKQKTASGVLWTGVARMSMQLVLFLNMLILARLLSKDDFGIVGMAAIVTVAITMVNEWGLGTSIVQKKLNSNNELSSMYWGSVIFGLLLMAASIALSTPASVYFKQPIVKRVFTVQSLGFLIGSFGIVQKSILTKKMQFKKLAIVEIISVLFYGLVSIIMALMGWGVWSIVIGSLVRELLSAIFLGIFCTWRPYFHFKWTEFKRYLGYSSAVLTNDAAIYATTNTDVAIIGRILGSELLGVYTFALYTVKLPVTRLSGIVTKVVFPAFSLVQDDLKKFKRGYLKSMTLISFFTFFLLGALMVFANEFIHIVLPEKWNPVIFPLQALAPMAMLKSVGTIRGSVFKALGRPDIELKWNVVYFIPLVFSILIGTQYGLNGVAVAFSAVYIITFPIIQYITNQLVHTTTIEYLLAFKSTFVSIFAAIFVGALFRYIIYQFSNLGDLGVLIGGLLLMGGVYIALMYILDKTLVYEIIEIFKLVRKKQKLVTVS